MQDEKLVRTVAQQTVTIQYILELAKSLKRDPRDCFNAFFARMATAQEEYTAAYNDEINSLIERVKDRAQVGEGSSECRGWGSASGGV